MSAFVSVHVDSKEDVKVHGSGPLTNDTGSFHSVSLDGTSVFFREPKVGFAIAKAFHEAACELDDLLRDRSMEHALAEESEEIAAKVREEEE